MSKAQPGVVVGSPALPPKGAGGIHIYIDIDICTYALGVCAHVCVQCSLCVCVRAHHPPMYVCVGVSGCHMVWIVGGRGGGSSGGGPTN